jgi:DNA primase
VIPPDFIPLLLQRIDIVDVVGAHVNLKKSGASLKGLCPFHGEKTPSFHVTPSRQTYHCFGCGAHGDALRFMMDHQGLGFIDAVQELARRAGLEVPNDTRSPEQRAQSEQAKLKRASLSELLAQAAAHYRQQLRQTPRAVEYLRQRGLTGQIAARFGLGYAPEGWRALSRCFPKYDDPDLENAGLVIQGEAQGERDKRYDRFRDRIMFPIRNVGGEVIGFGGRVLDRGEPKYLNSPETPVYSKGTELYGLYEARTAIRQRGLVLVVEGYMDVVALAQHGIAHAVATLGTACTTEQVGKLFRFTEHIVFSFDGDTAGRKAASRALQSALPHLSERRIARFLFLPTEHDPDSYVREHGAEAFESLIETAKPLSQHLLDVAGEGCRLDTPEGRARLIAQARPLLALLPAGLLQRQLVGEVAHLARVHDTEVMANAAADSPAPRPGQGDVDDPRPRRPRAPAPWRPRGTLRAPTPEDQLLRLLLVNAAWWERLTPDQHDKLLQRDTAHARVLGWLDRTVADHGPLAWAALRPLLSADEHALANLEELPHLTMAALDAQAQLESPASDLDVLIERLGRTGFFQPAALPPVAQD